MYTVDEEGVTIYAREVFDFSASSEFINEIGENFDANKKLTIDFSKTTFIDSSGIGALIAIHKSLPDSAPRIRLANLPPELMKMLSICRMDKFFEIQRIHRPPSSIRSV